MGNSVVFLKLSNPGLITWSPPKLICEIIEARYVRYNEYFLDPFILMFAPDWEKYLKAAYRPDVSVITGETISKQRTYQRILNIEGVLGACIGKDLKNYEAKLIPVILYEDVQWLIS